MVLRHEGCPAFCPPGLGQGGGLHSQETRFILYTVLLLQLALTALPHVPCAVLPLETTFVLIIPWRGRKCALDSMLVDFQSDVYSPLVVLLSNQF